MLGVPGEQGEDKPNGAESSPHTGWVQGSRSAAGTGARGHPAMGRASTRMGWCHPGPAISWAWSAHYPSTSGQ